MTTVSRSRPEEGIEVLTLDRPERLNAMNRQLLDDLEAALRDADRDPSCRVVVLTGAGRAFCAGLDLREMTGPSSGLDMGRAQTLMRHAQSVAGIVPTIRSVRKPTIAAINGVAAGGGMAMSLACDIRIAASSATLNAAFIKIGVSGCDLGLSWILPRLIGASRAFEIMLTGRMIDSEEAERIGLVSRVVEDGNALGAALDTARLITANSPFGVWMTKEVMWANLEVGSLSAGIDLENRTQVLGLMTRDHQEAVDAFLAKRPPVFTDS